MNSNIDVTVSRKGVVEVYVNPLGRQGIDITVSRKGVVEVYVNPLGRQGDKGEKGDPGDFFGSFETLAIKDDLIDQRSYTVASAFNGEPETFRYDATSTLAADGALIVDAVGMGVGRIVSTRRVYTTVQNAVDDTRPIVDGTAIEAESFSYRADSTASGGFIENSATPPVKLKALPVNGIQMPLAALNPAADGVVDDRAVFADADAQGFPVHLTRGKTYRVASDLIMDNPLHMHGAQIIADGCAVVIRRLVPGSTLDHLFVETNGGRVIVKSVEGRMDRRMYGAASDKPACPFEWGGPHPLPDVYYIGADDRAVYDTSYDVWDFVPEPDADYYIDFDIGSNGSGDGSEGNPYKTLGFAASEAASDEAVSVARFIMTGDQTHWRANLTTMEKSGIIESSNGDPVFLVNANPYATEWELTADQTNTYQVTDAALNPALSRVLDRSIIDDNGDAFDLDLQSSIATVEANPGTYWRDGNVCYVHASDSRNLATGTDDDILLLLNNSARTMQDNVSLYVNNVQMVGGDYALRMRATVEGGCELIGKDSVLKYSTTDDGFYSEGVNSYLQNCVGAGNSGDAFSYHDGIAGVSIGWAMELNCTGRHNGLTSPANTDNGSTAHDNKPIVRINGTYHSNAGPNLIDVNANEPDWPNAGRSWNVGCYVYGSVAHANSGTYDQRVNFKVRGSHKMWVEGGRSGIVTDDSDPTITPSDENFGKKNGSLFDFAAADVSGQGIIYLRNVRGAGVLNGETDDDYIGLF